MFDLFHGSEEAFTKPAKTLRAHQVRAIEMLRASAKAKNKRTVVQMPTGAGKTLTASKIIQSALGKGRRVIFTAPAIALIDQTVSAFEDEGIRDIGVMQANHPRTNLMAQVQVASVQTLARRLIPEASLVIVDECHIRSVAIERLMDDRPDVYFVGLSATPWAKGMGKRWQDLVIPCTIGDLIAQGFLSEFRVFAPDVPDLSGVKTVAGDYHEGQTAEVMAGKALMASVVNTWLERGENRPTLLFGVNRIHAKSLQEQFERAGIAAGYVDAFSDIVERKRLERQFRSGEVKVACSVRTLTTGVDWPVSCIIDAAPTKSEMLHVQKIGRGLRVNPGTEDLIVLDHAGNTLRLGLVTDIHHDRLSTAEKAEQEARPKAEKLPKACTQCETLHTGLTCPACGHTRKPVAGVETVDGELIEFTPKKSKATAADKQAFWSMAQWVDRERGKGGKLALALYKGRFNVWPRGLSNHPVAPDQAFMNYEHSRRIAFAKKKAVQ